MSVSNAIQSRKSVRAFTNQPVETTLLVDLLKLAARSPSGGNLQPWRIRLLNGNSMDRFRALMERRLAGEAPVGEELGEELGEVLAEDRPEYQVYPSPLKEPYRSARFKVGEDMYALLGIPRDDKPARLKWFANNFRFFGAPAGFFCFFDRTMSSPQWSDMGMFLQSFMLLCEEAGLATCPQECWVSYPATVSHFCEVPDEWQLFCGMAIGYEDKDHPVNQLTTDREPSEVWLKVME